MIGFDVNFGEGITLSKFDLKRLFWRVSYIPSWRK